MIGCGSIGQGLLPVLLKTLSVDCSQLTIITADEEGRHVADHFGILYLVEPLTPENYLSILNQHLGPADLLLNLSVNVSSLALIAWCKARDVLYLDTCVEPWSGGYVSAALPETTNAWLRQQALALHSPGAATAVIAHGMNPGLISHLLKQALLALANSKGVAVEGKPEWGQLAHGLGVKVVHISERDTQDDGLPLLRGEFANTWSAEGLYSESWLQRAELGWGSHESECPPEYSMQERSMCLAKHGTDISMRTWLPSQGEQHGMLLTHHEVISITEMLGTDRYCPTVCYVYSPCPKAQESLKNVRAGIAVADFCVLNSEAVQGFDEIGVLLIHDNGALWHGSTLTCNEAWQLAPYNSATSLQVVAGIIGALKWMLDHPHMGVVEAEDVDSEQVLAVALPYLGKVATVETAWSPGSHLTFGEFLVAGPSDHSHKYVGAVNIRHGKTKDVCS
jgi:homospermidine synthase